MSKLYIILSFLTMQQLKKINTLIEIDELHDESLACRIADLLENKENQISEAVRGDFGGSRGCQKNSLYGYLRYYGVFPDEGDLYWEFQQFYQLVSNMDVNQYNSYINELRQ
jgi:hypothetical protein